MNSVWDVIDHLEEQLELFKRDPADSDYQRGYEAALSELREYLLTVGVN